MFCRTDLAIESHQISGSDNEGIGFESENCRGMNIHRLNIKSEAAAKRLNKPPGKYITIESLPLTDNFRDIKEQICTIARELSKLIPESGDALVIGIGNTDITSDALGPLSAGAVIATRHIKGELARSLGLNSFRSTAVISPGVLGKTGIETGEIVLSLIKSLSPAVVIAVDSLASKSVSHLGKTIQLSDSGISPGSGIGNDRLSLSRKSLGIPVIGIGIPTVVDARTLVSDLSLDGRLSDPYSGYELMVTPTEIDLLVERGSKLIGMAINCALQKSYSFEDLAKLIS